MLEDFAATVGTSDSHVVALFENAAWDDERGTDVKSERERSTKLWIDMEKSKTFSSKIGPDK